MLKRRIGSIGRIGWLGVVLFAGCAPRAETPRVQPETVRSESPIMQGRPAEHLRETLLKRIQALDSGTVAVAFLDLETGRRIGINENEQMHAASTMKVPVLIELFRQAAEGKFALSDSLVIKNQFTSIADQSTYALSPGDDSDSTLYRREGSKVALRELARLMITRSSNLATNILIEKVTPSAIGTMLQSQQVSGMQVLRGVEDGPAFRRGMNNTTTANGLARALELIARCRVTNQAACAEMIDILAAQEFNTMIPAGLPAGTRVAHKTGWITGINHDGAIVFPPGQMPYVLVVLTRGLPDSLASARVAADLSRDVWQAVTAPDWLTRPRAHAGAPELYALYQKHRNPIIRERRFDQAELVRALQPYQRAFTREEIGRSADGQPLFLLRFGDGPMRVLLWSQMHGNESTATMALTDLVKFIAEAPGDELVQRWRQQLTVLLVPMLNPDGAGRFLRQNSYGIDINRDARALVTPEGQALKGVHDRYKPQFGFNLHDQNARMRVGSTDRLAAIALLAPPKDGSNRDDAQMETAKRVAVVVRNAVEPYVAGYVTRYDDTFNPRAFGDNLQRWGTATVLIESGGWIEDPEKQHLRAANFAALVSALDAIATKRYQLQSLDRYAELPANGRSVNDLLVRGGTIVTPMGATYRADILADEQSQAGREIGVRILDVGDLEGLDARDTIDVNGLFLHPARSALLALSGAQPYFGIGMAPQFSVLRGADPASEMVGVIENGAFRTVPRGTAMENVVVGCYQIQFDPIRAGEAPRTIPGHQLPARVRLLSTPGVQDMDRQGYQIRPIEGGASHRYAFWIPAADTVRAVWSTGFTGVRMELLRAGPHLKGPAIFFTDDARQPEERSNVQLHRIPCGS